MKARIKRLVFGLLGKEPEAVVVSFLSGDEETAAAMLEEIRRLVPGRRHFAVTLGAAPPIEGVEVVALAPGSTWRLYRELRRALRRFRIGLAPVLFTKDGRFRALRTAAFLRAPFKILAYNARLERHHLRLRTAIASLLFLRGIPLDRIFLRPRWLAPWKRDRPQPPETSRIVDGRPFSAGRRRLAVLSPYVPYPLSHGGAVRIFHLLREAARDFDVALFAFSERGDREECGPLLEFCARLVLVSRRDYREPRWSTLRPAEVREYRSRLMQRLWDRHCREWRIDVRQVEYTHLASYGGDVLVEHDVTFDLFRQVLDRRRSFFAWWDWWRWQRFERRALRKFRRVVVMSEKDARLAGTERARVIPNGVDLDRFRPEEEWPGRRLLFIGSFRHFPNVVAYRFFTEQVWPLLRDRFPEMTLTTVAGPDPLVYWREATDAPAPRQDARLRLLGFVRDVRPLYVEANLVIVPTLVSAGTNLKVLEAMAMERTVVSTLCGCAGLGLRHGESVWVADDAAAFAEGVARLLTDGALRRSIAAAARRIAEENFDWPRLGALQRALYDGLLDPPVEIRPAGEHDLEDLDRIQKASPEAVLWEPSSYLSYDCRIAAVNGRIAGFVVCRTVGERELEVLSLVVDPGARRRGVATQLMRDLLARSPGACFLEVRQSNWPARHLYRKLGFEEVSLRPNYYQDTGETAVVMRRQSC